MSTQNLLNAYSNYSKPADYGLIRGFSVENEWGLSRNRESNATELVI